MDTTADHSASSAEHLCVLVHGLWGNPDHLNFLTTSLREQYPEDKLHVLVAKRNSGSFTYDGIELGGERVTSEIEEKLEELARNGHEVKKISIIGYSLGGLISRYAIGLLYHKGVFERVQPVNFTTFATPHLGVRTPLTGTHNHIWNVLGARTLSKSGRQLFTIDKFRETGRPLLAILTDPNSVFIRGLAQFKHRSLYANIVNDRSVTYYTAGISRIDPYVDPESVKINYIKGYEPVIVDGETPVSEKEPEELPAFVQRLKTGTRTVFGRIPIFAFVVLFVPLGVTAFLLNSVIQSFRSQQRIRLHESGRAGIDIEGYRSSLVNNVRREFEDMFENVNNTQDQEYLLPGSEEIASQKAANTTHDDSFTKSSTASASDAESVTEKTAECVLEFPTLALTPAQFAMIDALDNIGFKKYPVYIHKHRHSHAAIICRRTGPSFDEGKVVVKHWLSEFEV